ncbi:hypothetical protein [Peterkaempfera bronchialis]|uniref:Uncharacterized protein n=1 Tax=Peterkaempfera bronchialis TaxID=2126346 RepID=A0A345T0N1_9ACTN|nr:hypothetical protein [Peterkaempfera bronchialis]AXI79536.1 hypothetical protein C7M71_021100 [Peterkaempfera bronchialis]
MAGVAARSVVAIGVPQSGGSGGPEEGPPALDALAPLLEAPQHAASIVAALDGFGYRERPRPADDADHADRLTEQVTEALGEARGVLVVHVVGHGDLARRGSGHLYVIGRDGRRVEESVDSWISRVEDHPEEDRPLTLLILDLCHSGAAASLPWHQSMRPERRRLWVIAATARDSKAFDCRLSRATATVLRRYRDDELRVDDSLPYLPLETVAREIDREVAELSAVEGYVQEIDVSRIPFTARLDHLPFFPNPRHRPGRRDRTAPAGAGGEELLPALESLDGAFDAWHFLSHGSGAEPLGRGVGHGYFHGRRRELRTLTGWFDGHGKALRVVTGKPGAGKSALLGVLVCAAHPLLRGSSRQLWTGLAHRPAENDRLAVVHARRRTLAEIADSVARQLGGRDGDRPEGGWGAESLLRLAGSRPGRPYSVVIDALDEAERPQDVTRALLLPLARTVAQDAGAGLRLLVGTREDPASAPLLASADAEGALTHLDRATPEEVYEALHAYIVDLLAVDTPYGRVGMVESARRLAHGIAARLTGVGDPDPPPTGAGPLDWGEFLVAGLYVRQVLERPAEPDPGAAERLGHAVPRDLPSLLEMDLARSGEGPLLRSVLAALAHAQGLGMPERVVRHVAAAFTPGHPDDGPLPTGEVRHALDGARFYLRRDVEVDGTTLYRLFHESLAEQLRLDPLGTGGGPAEPSEPAEPAGGPG